jgi:hypothetical protein
VQVHRPPLELWRALCCALAAGALAVWPALARADSVLLITPKRADAVAQDVFHRLEAELKIHGYDTETADSEAEAKPAARARAAGALAAIAIVKRRSAVTLQVWLIDRASGEAGPPRRIEAGGARDASSLLAVRAVDLLRATFGEPPASAPSAAPAADGGKSHAASPPPNRPATAPEPQPAAAPAQPMAATQPLHQPATPTTAATQPATKPADQPPAPTTQPAAKPADRAPTSPPPSVARPAQPEPEPANEPEHARARLWLSAEGALLFAGARFGTSFGPALGIDARLLPWLSVGAHGAAPLLGSELSTPSGSATITQELAWLEVRVRVLAVGRLAIEPLLGGGMAWLQGDGRPNEPLTPSPGHNWTFLAQLGLHVDVALLPRLHAVAAVRSSAFVPPLEVKVARDSARLSLPSLSATLGLALGLF